MCKQEFQRLANFFFHNFFIILVEIARLGTIQCRVHWKSSVIETWKLFANTFVKSIASTNIYISLHPSEQPLSWQDKRNSFDIKWIKKKKFYQGMRKIIFFFLTIYLLFPMKNWRSFPQNSTNFRYQLEYWVSFHVPEVISASLENHFSDSQKKNIS